MLELDILSLERKRNALLGELNDLVPWHHAVAASARPPANRSEIAKVELDRGLLLK